MDIQVLTHLHQVDNHTKHKKPEGDELVVDQFYPANGNEHFVFVVSGVLDDETEDSLADEV